MIFEVGIPLTHLLHLFYSIYLCFSVGGAHKSIQGWYTIHKNDPEQMNWVLNYFEQRGTINDTSDDGSDGEVEAEEDSDNDNDIKGVIEEGYEDENLYINDDNNTDKISLENFYETNNDGGDIDNDNEDKKKHYCDDTVLVTARMM